MVRYGTIEQGGKGNRMVDRNASLSEVAGMFIASLPAAQKVATQGELRWFLNWFGASRPISEITGLTVESYQDQVIQSGADLNRRLEPFKAFLAFAHRQGYLEANLAKYVKLRRSTNKKKETPQKAEVPSEEPVALTPEGFARLKAELEDLTTRVRAEVAHELEEARRDRDIRENAPYDAAKDRQAMVEARIRDLQRILASASMLENDGDSGRVTLGATVVLHDLNYGEEVTYTLVGSSEANPSQGRISISSPVGKALIDRQEGDTIEVAAPAGVMRYRIQSIKK